MIPFRIGLISMGEAVLSARACEDMSDAEIVAAVREAIALCKRPEIEAAKYEGVTFRNVSEFEEWSSEWRRKQSDREAYRRSAAFMRSQFANMSATVYAQILKRGDRDECAICAVGGRLTVDHIKPLSRGGTNDLENLRLLCRPCNSAKGAREGVDEKIRKRRSAA